MKPKSGALAFAIAASVIAGAAHASIRIPFFKTLSENQVCGGVPGRCQPTSSQRWARVANADYHGNPAEFLGTSYSNAFERTTCVAGVTRSDVVTTGTNNFTGTLSDDASVDFTTRATANLAQLLQALTGTLPGGLQGGIESELRDIVSDKVQSTIALTYQRVDLAPSVLQSVRLTECLQNTPRNQRVITGFSVIRVSGTWGRDSASDLVSRIEASAGFQQLSAEIKANWDREKSRVLQGSFEPMSYVFAVAYRRGTRANN